MLVCFARQRKVAQSVNFPWSNKVDVHGRKNSRCDLETFARIDIANFLRRNSKRGQDFSFVIRSRTVEQERVVVGKILGCVFEQKNSRHQIEQPMIVISSCLWRDRDRDSTVEQPRLWRMPAGKNWMVRRSPNFRREIGQHRVVSGDNSAAITTPKVHVRNFENKSWANS